jgi:hypothetical protein
MRLKLKIGVLSLTLLLFSLILYSCVDEPFIEPVKQPFSEIRVLNLSHNINNMSVFIDKVQPSAALNGMAIPSTTEYFDVRSGERLFEIYDEAGKLVYSGFIDISSYERMLIIFAGEYSEDPLFSTFAEIRIFEGYVYVDHSPVAGTSTLSIIHAAAPSLDISERTYTKITALAPAGDGNLVFQTYKSSAFEFEDIVIVDSAYAGDYNITFSTASDSVSYSTSFTSDKRGYIYLYGRPDNVQFYSYEITPPPARQRN